VGSLPGSPDLANKSRRWAIFVNGCFWHHHTCSRGSLPYNNRLWWIAKFSDTRKRDKHHALALRQMGFHVLVIWECETRDPARLSRKVAKWLRRDATRVISERNQRSELP
jgi:DNA mismatch endonuclease (patch repair protein)